jgi:hypothetical protein
MALTGEIRRAFFKHRVFSELWVVEIDETGLVLAALNISSTAASACRHGLADYALSMDAAAQVNDHVNDYEVFEPVCVDATHQLRDIFEADRLSEQAFGAWQTADNHAKALKKTYEQHVEAAAKLRKDYREPRDLPLFPRNAA